jgi:hypothetical protein
MKHIHVTFGQVVRSGATKWLKCGPSVPCTDSNGKVRLLLIEPQYWVSIPPIVREFQHRSWFGSHRKRASTKRACSIDSTVFRIAA